MAQSVGQDVEVTVTVQHVVPGSFNLLAPANGYATCDERPVFSWEIPSLGSALTGEYLVQIWDNEGGSVINGRVSDSNLATVSTTGGVSYRSWTNAGKFFLELTKPFSRNANLTYYWKVTAYSVASGSIDSATFNFRYRSNCDTPDQCAGVNMPDIQIVQPTPGRVSTNRPRIVFNMNYDQISEVNFEVKIDGQVLANGLHINSANTDRYNISYDSSRREISLTPLVDLWDGQSDSNHTISVHGVRNNCGTKTASVDVEYRVEPVVTPQCEMASGVPILLSPAMNSVMNMVTAEFTWKVCLPLSCMPNQNFVLNQIPLFDLAPRSMSTADYSLWVRTAADASCGRSDFVSTRFTLTLNRETYQVGDQMTGVAINDESDINDWNYWKISSEVGTSPNATSRFRVIERSGGIYHWCSNQNQCVSGSVTECLESGRACYVGEDAAANCQANAVDDCSGNRGETGDFYFWCTSTGGCRSGLLEACYLSGRPCYLSTNRGSETCQASAEVDCAEKEEKTCSWCYPTANNCETGSCEKCEELGRTCFPTIESAKDCEQNPDISCYEEGGMLTLEELVRLLTVTDNYFLQLLSDLGLRQLAEQMMLNIGIMVERIEGFATQVFPAISLLILLPIAILLAVFFRRKGLVVKKINGIGVEKALVLLEMQVVNPNYADEEDFVIIDSRLTDEKGNFRPFTFSETGWYRMRVILDDVELSMGEMKKRFGMRKFNYYTGQVFKMKKFQKMMAVIETEAAAVENEALSWSAKARIRVGFRRIWRYISPLGAFLAGTAFVLTCVYPIFINLLVSAIFLIAIIERLLLMVLERDDLNLLLIDELGVPLVAFPMRISKREVGGKQVVKIKATDSWGRLKGSLKPGEYNFEFLVPYARLINRGQDYNSFTLKVSPKKKYKNVLMIRNVLRGA